MKAVFLDFATMGPEPLDLSSLRASVPDLTLHAQTPAADVSARIGACEIVFTNKARLSREIIDSAKSLRFIGLTATGVDNVDLAAAKDNGVAVCNVRAYCTNSVVEHVFAVLLQLTRNLPRYTTSVRAGEWQKASAFCMLDFPIRQLSAMTLGIVGFGELGRGVAAVAEAFGMQVQVARRVGTGPAADDGRVALDDLLQQCDAVSLHCPLNDATRGLIGARELDLMKPQAILVNTARGALVDSAALVAALTAERIGGAAIDVLSKEPPVNGDPLLDYRGDNLMLTPHIAWASIEARQNAIDELTKNLETFLAGGHRNRVD